MPTTDNSSLHKGKKGKNDEFYTLYETVENEMKCYINHFKGKKVYCNCDDYEQSNFVKYLRDNFKALGLVSLTSTCYVPQGKGKCLRMDENGLETYLLKGDGDFRSDECIEILEDSDIVVTNPPFSLFREYINLITKYKVNFLLLSNGNSITYKDVYQKFINNEIWCGVTLKMRRCDFIYNGILTPINNVSWLTNIRHGIYPNFLDTDRKYDETKYHKYDNYDGIDIKSYKDIPMDYDGVMGVPISFIHYHNPNQFDIIGFRKGNDGKDLTYTVNGEKKQPYFRILIKRHNEQEND